MADIFELFKKIAKDNDRPEAAPISHLVVGLGNPGEKYHLTRHNAGFLCLDYIAQSCGVRIDRLKFHAMTAQATVGGHSVLLMKPQTYMNNSGEAVREAAAFYKIPPENIVVLFDDISLDVGRLRVRRNGSDGGHNGIKSLIYHLNSDAFPRIKVGVGAKPHPGYDLAAWVLSEFNKEEKETLFDTFPVVLQGCEKIVAGRVDDAMQLCNGRK